MTWRLRNRRKSRDQWKNSITKSDQNTEKSPGDMKKLDVTQTPVRNHQLTLVRKTSKEVNNTDDKNNSSYNYNQKTWSWLRKGNFKRETESLLIVAQDNAIRTNHIKARIDKTQQNSKCRLCVDWVERINHIISECSKLAQKEYKARHDWVGKVIIWEMCWKF